MDEARVKRAFDVARDAASDAAFHTQTQIVVFNRVFDAMLYEPSQEATSSEHLKQRLTEFVEIEVPKLLDALSRQQEQR